MADKGEYICMYVGDTCVCTLTACYVCTCVRMYMDDRWDWSQHSRPTGCTTRVEPVGSKVTGQRSMEHSPLAHE